MTRTSMLRTHRFIAAGLAATLLVAGATAAQAQRKTAEDVAKEADIAARAKKDAAALRAEAEHSPVKPLMATAPVTADNIWVLDLSDGGHVRIQLRPDAAPTHVERIKDLTRKHFYDGLVFHRVIDGFMAQGGDPKGDGTGGSELPDLKQEFTWLPHMRGTVSMARSESEDSANSQFYIMLMPRLQLDHKYTVFGRVISGMDGVDKIAKGEPPESPTKIVRAYIEGDNAAASIAPAPAG
ncbi:MAG: peptidylprolyl isomerase [Sphingobium sp.]|nr:peptidylprolyl isomerase [Sphingobium sp.]